MKTYDQLRLSLWTKFTPRSKPRLRSVGAVLMALEAAAGAAPVRRKRPAAGTAFAEFSAN